MAVVNGYTTLATLKARLNISGSTDDTTLEQAIEAASRQIDGLTNRRFYADAAATRYFTAEWSDLLVIDDLITLTTLKTDEDGDRVYETTWSATDYDLEPYNAPGASQPYTKIEIAPNGTRAFPTIRRGVEIVGDWGYAATTPDAIEEACLLLATRLYMRPRNAPFGLAAAIDSGAAVPIPGTDADVRALLMPYRRFAIGAV